MLKIYSTIETGNIVAWILKGLEPEAVNNSQRETTMQLESKDKLIKTKKAPTELSDTNQEDLKEDVLEKRKLDVLSGAVIGENVFFQKTLQTTVNEGLDDMVSQARRYKENPLSSRTGYVAEADHCATFNTRKALERDKTRAVRQPNGNHGDYKIVKGDKVVVEGEVKYYGSAEKTENSMRKYDDQQLVGPSDQIKEIKEIARKKAAKGNASSNDTRQQTAREHEAVEKNVSDSITDCETKSTPRTRKEAKKITRKATKGKVAPEDVMPPLGESVGTAMKSGGLSGAKMGMGFTAVVSGVSNINAWVKDEKNGQEALFDAAKDIATGTIDGGVKGAVASGATVLAIHAATMTTSTVAKTVLRSNAPVVAAITAFDVAKDVFNFANGNIDGAEFCKKTTRNCAVAGAGWAGAETGAVFGSFLGPIGTVAGGVVGGMIGCFLAGSWFD